MASFGKDLQREREERNISLDAIADSTKISVRHLKALEEEDFGELPGGVFNKGIVRGYTRSLGLDEQQWAERFMVAYRQSGALKADDAEWIAFQEIANNEEIGKSPWIRLRWAGVLAMGTVVLGIAALAWFLLSRRI